ncbi:ATP-binding cassette domain-containing protein, partial [Akkermansia muciniphila]
HFMLVPSMTVAENVVLGIECKRSILFDYKRAVKEVRELCEKYGFQIDPEAKVRDISIGVQQKVEIVKALYRKAEVLILDEPTAVLTPQEITELGVILQDLKKAGKTIIIITHKLKEIMDFSDRITVLRLGKKIGTVETKDTTAEDITVMMVGRHVDLAGHKEESQYDDVMLEVRDLSYRINGKKQLDQVSFSLRKGEILGVAGFDGSGQNELTEVLGGYRKADSGKVFYKGEEITQYKTRERRKDGIGIIPQGRHELGLVLDMSVEENLLLGDPHIDRFTKNKIFLNVGEIANNAEEKIKKYAIKTADRMVSVRTLSGGHQQKLICARETGPDVELIIANQPTRGIDVGATEMIRRSLIRMARQKNVGTLLVSADLNEVLEVSDRLLVMRKGK